MTELDRLTEAFVEARYSVHEVGRAEEEHVRADARKIRAALRTLRRSAESNKAAADRSSEDG
jgi:hypothetical protein